MKKVALVTGTSSGIGKVTALQLQKDGYLVYGAARRIEKMEDLKSRGIKILSLDVTDDQSMISCINSITETEGRIDVLVNNAGYGHFGTIEDSSIEVGRAQYEVNVFGLARMCQLVIPHMRKQKFGKIVNVSSIGGKITTPFGGWYQSTKYAVESLSDAMRMELKQFGIDVIIIEPGGTESEWADHATNALLKISGNGPYKKSVAKAIKSMENGYKKASPATVISDTISKALKSNKPKARYACGHRASSTLIARRWLSDRVFDRMITREFMDKDV